MNREEFIKELEKINVSVTEEKLAKLDKYYKILVEENKKYNLTSITDKKEVYLKHFYDSLTIQKAIKLENQYICDIGSGAGFPGMVIKIMNPEIKIDLLDATQKKCHFLNKVIKELSLEKINVINTRVEEYAKENREKYDIVTSRAVASLKHLLEFGIPLLKINGTFIAMKANLDGELENIENYYKKLSLENEKIIKFKLPYENSNRSIFIINKIKETNIIYPRQYNQIKKHDI